MNHQRRGIAARSSIVLVALVGAAIAVCAVWYSHSPTTPAVVEDAPPSKTELYYQKRDVVDSSGFYPVMSTIEPWSASATLQEIAAAWHKAGYRANHKADQELAKPNLSLETRLDLLTSKAFYLNYEGEPKRAYEALVRARREIEAHPKLAQRHLYTIIYLQGVTALRRGETENCVECRGESSCILPISPAARHLIPDGSLLAIRHFTEYLEQFPDDVAARWLLNLAHATLGQHPHQVPARFRTTLDRYCNSELDIGKFRDVGHLVGVNRCDQSGGAILDDFDNDGRLDVFVTSLDPTAHAAFYRNVGDGTFKDLSAEAGLLDQLGGLNCVQTDYNNDGFLDVFVARGAWMHTPIRPSLLRNNGNGTFTDVTRAAGLARPVNSISGVWADYDNDGWLDLFVCCDKPPNFLYRNRGDGTFENVTQMAGPDSKHDDCKGATWIDYDDDGFPDLFINQYRGAAQLHHNNRDGTFTDVTEMMGIDGPNHGFSCWTWDYDNDGRLDLFATCYDFTHETVIDGLEGRSRSGYSNRLFRNVDGKRFEDVTIAAGLDKAFATMGSNYGDFDNDGFLDFYLGTGALDYDCIVPNRMLKNVEGKRFADVTGSSGTGHLQKGHGVACGDWDRDGDVDVLIQMGGAASGDKYHNVLFQNPGRGNNWLVVKLVGTKSNRAAIGARIKVVTAGAEPLTIHRHVGTGSSFGANPLQQTIGLAQAETIAHLEIDWPTSRTTQRLHNLPVNQAIEMTELRDGHRQLDWTPIPLPKPSP